MCVDFTDLNKPCPKDSYPLPRIDLLVDSTLGCERLSMLDAYQGYNQIKLAKEDQEKMSFITDRGLYCYNVMPFGLKNAGATYQRMVNKIFAPQIGRNMEIYVDDMLVESQKWGHHLSDLKECFAQLRVHGVKLNLNKCVFGVERGKFLGYLVTQRGIEANPDKIQAIQQMRECRNAREVQRLMGRMAALNRFSHELEIEVYPSSKLSVISRTFNGQKNVIKPFKS
ncbi:UNVERIFIED_CONTAM: Polyprotein P3 [Sesamum radiatum]|uniref:Polyprotein P3 n=1 Tax=Sesamum radiatum TaxID=300843 RepID=A0AAW2TIL9_SESRA